MKLHIARNDSLSKIGIAFPGLSDLCDKPIKWPPQKNIYKNHFLNKEKFTSTLIRPVEMKEYGLDEIIIHNRFEANDFIISERRIIVLDSRQQLDLFPVDIQNRLEGLKPITGTRRLVGVE